MDKKRILSLVPVLILSIICLYGIDISLKYKLTLADYFKYNVSLTKEEQEFLAEKPLTVSIYDDPPLSFTNSANNAHSGIVVDYLSQLAVELGNNFIIRVSPKFKQTDALQEDETDIIITADDDVESSLLLTQPLLISGTKALVRNTESIEHIHQLRNKTFVLLTKDASDKQLREFLQLHQIETLQVENMYQAFALLHRHPVDGLLGDDMEITHFLRATNRTSQFKFLDGSVRKNEVRLAVHQDNPMLCDILNKGILSIKKKNLIIQTQKKWLGDYDSDNIDIRFLETIYTVIFAILTIVGGLSVWNYVMRRQVNRKTKELSESKEELRLIIDTMHSGLMVIGHEGTIIECNDAVTKYTGIPREELLGKSAHEFEEVAPFLLEKNRNVVFKLKNSYYYVSKQNLTSGKDMIFIEDYTEKYFAEKKARQEARLVAVGQLSAGLAHEIRNPLGLIKSYSFLIEKDHLNSLSTHAVSVIYDCVHRINHLIENLLKFSRLSNEEKKCTLVRDFVGGILEMEKQQLGDSSIMIRESIQGQDEGDLMINQDVLRLIFANLIRNSIDSFRQVERADKTIDIQIDIEEDVLKICFRDNGSGIESERLEHIFDPFYSTKENGTGLGLYIISTEIYNINGKISVDSILNEGTRFDIELPIERADHE